MGQPQWIDSHLSQILQYQKQINELKDDVDTLAKINLLSKLLVLIGRLSAELTREYKMIYARRKQVHAEAFIKASKNKAAEAELAVVEIRIQEANAQADMKRWSNGFDSTREEINALKYKLKVDIEDGSGRVG